MAEADLRIMLLLRMRAMTIIEIVTKKRHFGDHDIITSLHLDSLSSQA